MFRFRRAASYLRESITSESQQLGVYGGLGGRVGTTLSLSIKRQKIQENTLRILGEVMFMAQHKRSTKDFYTTILGEFIGNSFPYQLPFCEVLLLSVVLLLFTCKTKT